MRESAVVLKVRRPVRETVFGTGNRTVRALHVYAVGANCEIVVLAGGLISQTPVWSHAADVDGATGSVIGLGRTNVLGAVDRAHEIKMVVPHGVAANSGDVLRQAAVDQGS